MGMAYSAEASEVLAEAETLVAETLTDHGLQEADLVARRLLGDKDLQVHLFVVGAGIIWTIRW
jgi:hypothetical protein